MAITDPYDIENVLSVFSPKPHFITKYFLDEDENVCYLFRRSMYSRISVITLVSDGEDIIDVGVWKPSDEALKDYFKELGMKIPEFYEI